MHHCASTRGHIPEREYIAGSSALLSVSRSQEKEKEVTRDCGRCCASLRVSTRASLRVSTGILRVALSRETAAAVPDSLGLPLC
jgi:hypothetical protein